MIGLGWTELLIIVVIIAVVVLAVTGMVRSARRSASPPQPRLSPADLNAQAHVLIAQDKKIHAIKLVREQTGLGLAEAKRYVDDLAAGRVSPLPKGASPLHGDLAERVRDLKEGGRSEQAVLLVRGETGMTEDEARRFVEAIG
ncbi:ribosomal protein L7/L12 [Planobispora siamensis]|uniref:Large ribosomal subunit protein bL12 C-terminal domain-containing protein n=1 Tax=Planobispora siamensis TaxID=936338 RepID=A0A8J3WP79_9ACTN|nr:ribosomal protein L7/L12 [Planobispora siamensis]GIH96858.1 hypothetical protein Psi01_74880 [Planobispora siamensis]